MSDNNNNNNVNNNNVNNNNVNNNNVNNNKVDNNIKNNVDNNVTKMDDYNKMDNVTRFNKTLHKLMSPSEMYKSFKNMAKDVASLATIEGEVLLDRTGTIITDTVDKFGNTFHKHYSDFVNTTKDAIIDVSRELKHSQTIETNQYNDFVNATKNAIIDITQEIKKPIITGIPPMNLPMDKRRKMAGGGDDFMKYVYTAKPIWFTKKDMIWN